jgi:hypothetical protein
MIGSFTVARASSTFAAIEAPCSKLQGISILMVKDIIVFARIPRSMLRGMRSLQNSQIAVLFETCVPAPDRLYYSFCYKMQNCSMT